MIRLAWMLLLVPMAGCQWWVATDRDLETIWLCHERAVQFGRDKPVMDRGQGGPVTSQSGPTENSTGTTRLR